MQTLQRRAVGWLLSPYKRWLLSALAHQVGVTLTQHAVDDKTNEITAVEPLLQQLVLEGRIVTMDALLTQRHIA